MAEQQSGGQPYQSKFGIAVGLNKSADRLALEDGEYVHMKNGFPSSEQSDEPFVQNAPSNQFCCDLPEGYFVINKPVYVQERELNIVCLVNPLTQDCEIGYVYVEKCQYVSVINSPCFNFNINHPIKGTYKIINCELSFYFQDGFNPDRKVNLDNLPYKKEVDENGCVVDVIPLELDCGQINIQNDLLPPVVKVLSVEETGALLSGAYQFAVCYSNINGDNLSSYYSKTNIVPIYEDSPNQGWSRVEGSKPNVITSKSIVVGFDNLDIRYEYINLAVIKTIQGSSVYERVATIPTGSKNYIYTGRETTKILSIDELLGLYPDYINSQTITSANNYLIRANLSTQDEGNYQKLANLIELGWAAAKIKADDVSQSYKNPLTTTEKTGYQRGEVYPFGLRLLFTNGKKSNVYHIPGRTAKPEDLVLITEGDCNVYELTVSANPCIDDEVTGIPYWQLYDTATVDYVASGSEDVECFVDIFASGEFAYWESTAKYPCNEEVWGELAGLPIRHHKFPSNETFHIQNQPYSTTTSPFLAYNNTNVFLYPVGVTIKKDLEHYLNIALTQGYLTQEEVDLIAGYEIVRGDRRGQKSVIAKGLLYNMFSYTEDPPDSASFPVYFPNYPFNELSGDPYLNDSTLKETTFEPILVEPTGVVSYLTGDTVAPVGTNVDPKYDEWENPFGSVPISFQVPSPGFTTQYPFEVVYSTDIKRNVFNFPSNFYRAYIMTVKVYDASGNNILELEDEVSASSIISDLSSYSKNLFTFHSPDTSFRQPVLGTYIKNHVLSYGACKQQFQPVEGHPVIKPAVATDAMNHAVSCKSEGNYNNWEPINPSDYRRQIVDSGYLSGNTITATESDKIINNRTRESSVLIGVNCNIENPSVIDTSKNVLSDLGKCGCRNTIEDRPRNAKNAYSLDALCTSSYQRISSYYVSLNTKVPNQYGDVFTIRYVSTGKFLKRDDSMENQTTVFGGDTFITRFSVKRKTGFFDVDFINQSAFGVDYTNNYIGAKPNYYLRNTGGAGKFVIDKNKSNLDCSVSDANRNGWVYLYNIGVANFFVESDVNTELRYSGQNIWEKWYPSLKQTSFYKWTEQLYCPIEEDNYYYYNWNYSKQNTEEALFTPARDFVPNKVCKNTHPRRIIYSKQSNEEESSDNWQIYPANQYYDVDSYLGSIKDVEAIDSFKVLVRCDNGSLLFNAYDTLELQNTTVTLGTGGMFAQRPQTFGSTDAGYVGSHSKFAIDVTPNGVFFADTQRQEIYWYTGNMQNIATMKMGEWFIKNIPSKFLASISNLENFDLLVPDNPFYGFGLQSIYDYRYNLWFLIKKDYVLKNLSDVNNITITTNGELLYNGEMLNFNDTDIFEDASWNISFRPMGAKSLWFSFHSFTPNVTFYGEKKFFTLQNNFEPKVYKHWDSDSFQTYYGELHPFEVTLTTSQPGVVQVLQSVEYELKNYKITNSTSGDQHFTHLFNFNKAIISTDNQSSGNLKLLLKDKNDLSQRLTYPKLNITNPSNPFIEVLYSKIEGNKYRLNQFTDIVADKENGLPIFANSSNGVDKIPVNLNYNRINNEQLKNQKFRNAWFDVTFIQDESDEYKMVLNLLLNRITPSQR